MPSKAKQQSISNVLSFPHRLQNTLTFYYLFPILILFVILSAYFYFTTKSSLDDELGKRLNVISVISAAKVKPVQLISLQLAQGQTFDLIDEAFKKIINQHDIQRIYVLSPKGEILLDTRSPQATGLFFERYPLHKTEIQYTLAGLTSSSTLFKGVDGDFYKTSFSPIISDDGKTQAVVGIDANASFFKNLRNLERRLVGLGVFFIIMILLISFLLSQKIVTPIEHLAMAAKSIGDGQLEKHIAMTSKNEIGFLGFVMDEMRKKILERDARLQVMLRGIAHEIRNPLGGIELFAGLLKDEVKEEASKEKVNKVIKETRTLQKLVDEFLDFAKTPMIQKSKIDLNVFLKDIVFYWKDKMEDSDIALHVQETDIAYIYADEERLKRCFHNLIENAKHAIDEMPQNKKINVLVKQSQHHILFCIQDFGSGIKAEHMRQLFQPFFTTKKFGNGLGLAMVQKVIYAHGGDVEIETDPEHGTKILIMLPHNPLKKDKA